MIASKICYQGVEIDQDFKDLREQLRTKYPELKVRHAGAGPEGTAERPPKPRPPMPPLAKLARFIEKRGIKLIDFFNSLDVDHSMAISRDELREGIQVYKKNRVQCTMIFSARFLRTNMNVELKSKESNFQKGIRKLTYRF